MKTFAFLFLSFLAHCIQGQAPKGHLEAALKKLQVGDYQGGIIILDQIIKLNPKDYSALFNRAVSKSILRQYESAYADINLAIALKPDSKKAILNRGIIRKKLTDYIGAENDFNLALQIDPQYSDALYNKGVLFEYIGEFEKACEQFTKAKELGSIASYPKVDFCQTPINERVKAHSILKLEKISTDKTYGFSSKNPVKVGTGSNGGLENEQTYLDLIRDETGRQISYAFSGKCCDYFTKNVTAGKAYLSQYDITYQLKSGASKTTKLFLSQFDFENPMILAGFKTIVPIK